MNTRELRLMAGMWTDGTPVTEIARKLGVSDNAVNVTAHTHRELFPYRRECIPEDTLRVMARMWAEGASTDAIAGVVGMTPGAAHRHIERRRDLFPRRHRGRRDDG